MQGYFINNLFISPPVVLAPMADVTNGAFRRVCARVGGVGLFCTEQISTMAMHYASARTQHLISWTEAEHPLSVQLFGADPDIMAEAAKVVADLGADIVDINMGCWVPKVCRQGAGAALLKDEETAQKVVEAVVNAVTLPVTVKMRAGWDNNLLTSVPLARSFEQIGARAFTLHARTARQGFDGSADWRLITEIKQAVGVPVIGNGDIKRPEDALRMMELTGCDGVMIGRAAIGNPWIIRDASHYLLHGMIPPAPTLRERSETAMEHLTDLANSIGEKYAVRHLRGQLPLYFKGFPGAVHLRERIVMANTIAEVGEIFTIAQEEATQGRRLIESH